MDYDDYYNDPRTLTDFVGSERDGTKEFHRLAHTVLSARDLVVFLVALEREMERRADGGPIDDFLAAVHAWLQSPASRTIIAEAPTSWSAAAAVFHAGAAGLLPRPLNS